MTHDQISVANAPRNTWIELSPTKNIQQTLHPSARHGQLLRLAPSAGSASDGHLLNANEFWNSLA